MLICVWIYVLYVSELFSSIYLGNIRVFCRIRRDDRVRCVLRFPDAKVRGYLLVILLFSCRYSLCLLWCSRAPARQARSSAHMSMTPTEKAPLLPRQGRRITLNSIGFTIQTARKKKCLKTQSPSSPRVWTAIMSALLRMDKQGQERRSR